MASVCSRVRHYWSSYPMYFNVEDHAKRSCRRPWWRQLVLTQLYAEDQMWSTSMLKITCEVPQCWRSHVKYLNAEDHMWSTSMLKITCEVPHCWWSHVNYLTVEDQSKRSCRRPWWRQHFLTHISAEDHMWRTSLLKTTCDVPHCWGSWRRG